MPDLNENTTQLTWRPGTAGVQQCQTKPRDERKVWGWVAVACDPNEFQVALDGNTGPDFGPVDAPCVLATELPVVVLVTRLSPGRQGPPATSATAGISWGHGCPPDRSRGRVLTLVALAPAALAPWESVADLVNPAATADWLDAVGAVLSTFAARGYRPQGAVAIRLSMNTDVRLRGF